MPNKNYAAEPLTEVPEVKQLMDEKMKELQTDKPYSIDKITRSCDRSISVNFQTYKVSTILSATVNNPNATKEEIDAMSAEIYAQAEAQTLLEINKIAQALGR